MHTAIFVLNEIGVTAQVRVTEGVFIVLPGSIARRISTPSWHPRNRRRREELIKKGALVEDAEDPQQYRFVEEVSFFSPSAAASLILARETKGRTVWKHRQTGQTYAEWTQQGTVGD